MSSPSNDLSYVNPICANVEPIPRVKVPTPTLTDVQIDRINLILSHIIPFDYAEATKDSSRLSPPELYVHIEAVEKWRPSCKDLLEKEANEKKWF